MRVQRLQIAARCAIMLKNSTEAIQMKFLDGLLVAAFLFIVGSMLGWVIEVLFRRFFSAKKWINPGFLTGPYIPLYGFGLSLMFAISLIPIHTGYAWLDALLIILIMGAMMTVIEYIAGLIFIKGMKIKLWDYSKQWGNIQGIICPLFSFLWLLVAAGFYFLMNEAVLEAVKWFVNNMWFSFFVGIVLGIFLVDLGHSLDLSVKIRKFAQEKQIVVHFERLKESIKEHTENFEKKHASFCFPFKSARKLNEELDGYAEKVTEQTEKK